MDIRTRPTLWIRHIQAVLTWHVHPWQREGREGKHKDPQEQEEEEEEEEEQWNVFKTIKCYWKDFQKVVIVVGVLHMLVSLCLE